MTQLRPENQILYSADKAYALDKDGYLLHMETWCKAVADAMAKDDGIVLTSTHWLIIQALRKFYVNTQVAPIMRVFVRLVSKELGPEIGNSLTLQHLFSSKHEPHASPARVACRIAGLPRPTNCL